MTTPSDASSNSPLKKEEIPLGFRFGAVRAGIKASGNFDLACALADQDCCAAAMFTSNRVQAAPIAVGKRHLLHTGHRVRAVVVNSGNANCGNGDPGLHAAERVCSSAAQLFGCDPELVFPSSTGIIGVPFPAGKVLSALPELQASLGASADHFGMMAQAIMTTDTRPKIAAKQIEVDGRTIRLAGIAKGAGMIHPRLEAMPSSPHATLLVYIFTDAALGAAPAANALRQAVEETFNRISIDGDTSTNDTVLLLASGASGAALGANLPLTRKDASLSESDDGAPGIFQSALREVCLSLAKQIVSDGEGAQHLVELNISGALSDRDALLAARAIANSPLFKTAIAGCDPNWGRILAAAGYSGASINPALISIRLGELELCRNGMALPHLDAAAAHVYLQQHEIVVHVDFGVGQGKCRFWTCDLTAEYVRINADYST